MATIWERAKNLVDDHQDRQAAAASEHQKQQALYTARDALLAKTLTVYQDYRVALAETPDQHKRESIHATYAARFAGINDAFAVLRQSEPGITTEINVEQYRRQAERKADHQARLRAYEQSLPDLSREHTRTLVHNHGDNGYSYLSFL